MDNKVKDSLIALTSSFEKIDVINEFTGLRWIRRFNEVGEFELWAPLTDANIELLREENLIWRGKDEVGIIEYFTKEFDSSGNFRFHIKGRFYESVFERRVISEKVTMTDVTVYEFIKRVIDESVIEPIDERRKLDNLEIDYSNIIGKGELHSFEVVGENLLSVVYSALMLENFSMTSVFDEITGRMKIRFYEGRDKAKAKEEGGIILSTDLSDLIDSVFELSTYDERTFAFVAGELDFKEEVDSTSQVGFFRREIFVDAENLSRDKEDGTEMTDEEYASLLFSKGAEEVNVFKKVQNFQFSLRQDETSYVFGDDYELGDKIIIQDLILGNVVSATVTSHEVTWDESGENSYLVVGNSVPTLLNLIKRKE